MGTQLVPLEGRSHLVCIVLVNTDTGPLLPAYTIHARTGASSFWLNM